jgi:general secretion pathway protein D
MIVLLSLALAACNSATFNSDDRSDVDVLDKVRSLDLTPRYPNQVRAEQPAAKPARPAIYEGSRAAATTDEIPVGSVPAAPGSFQTADASVDIKPTGNGFELNFENTPVAAVAKVVLGEILGVGYTIDSRVQGTVTLASVRPVPKSDMIYVLESALRLNGVVLVRGTGGYRLIPLGDAVGSGNVDANGASPEPGYGISVVPLQYISAPTLLKLLDSFALKPGTVRADSGRNLLLIQGTGSERRAAVDAALSFDADWMRGRSVGIFPIANGNPEPIIAELEKIMDSGENGLSQNLVKFQAVSRMNAIMVVAGKPALLHTAETWIKRLDSANTARNSVHVYRIKYGEAKQIAKVLNDMFGGGSSGSLDNASSQLAPGTGSSLSSSSMLGSSSSQSSGSGSSSQQPGNVGLVANRGFGGTPAPAVPSAPTSSTSGLDTQSSSSGGKPLLEGVKITPDTVNNTLLIYADQENYRLIEDTLRQVDRPQLQVAIDATIAEVTLNDELSYGVQAYLTSKNLGLGSDKGSFLNTTSTSAPAAATASTVAGAFINRAFPGFNFLLGSESQPSAILDALHSVTDTKVLSNPSLVVIDNQVATLQVGDQVPISTGSATVLTTSNTVVNTVDYKNTGIILKVAPRVNANGNVRLDIEQEISSVSPTTAAGSLTPTIADRTVKSSISVASGQTVLLAGLISQERDGTHNGIPGLDQIQDIGNLFSHNDHTSKRTELIIFIRPQIIRDGSDAHNIAEELRAKLRGSINAADETRPHMQRVQ